MTEKKKVDQRANITKTSIQTSKHGTHHEGRVSRRRRDKFSDQLVGVKRQVEARAPPCEPAKLERGRTGHQRRAAQRQGIVAPTHAWKPKQRRLV